MKEDHKKLIEHIIRQFKETENGSMYKETFVSLFEQDHNLRLAISNILLKDLTLIDRQGDFGYRLNENGWNFTTFADEELKQTQLKLKENIELENLQSSNKLNKWLYKTKWFL